MTVVQSGRNPFSIFLLFGLLVSGLSGLVAPITASAAVARLLPHWELFVWYGGLVAASACALVGIFAASVVGLLVERIGLSTLAVLTCGYTAAVAAAGGAGNVAAVISAGLVIACCVRVWQITGDLRRIDRDRPGGPPEEAQPPDPESGEGT